MQRMKIGGQVGCRGALALAALALVACSSDDGASGENGDLAQGLIYEAGSSTFCVLDPTRGFDPTAGIRDGQRLLMVEAWYPVNSAIAADPAAKPARFGDYFAGDPALLER
jgi:hypothetical protein